MHKISVVVPVYKGAQTLASLLAEIHTLSEGFVTEGGNSAIVVEVLLVHDHGPDSSDMVIRDLAQTYDYVRPVWLSRNFGQHAATLAGMASSGGDWIVTLDEDGQHDPAQMGVLLDAALVRRASVVYAKPVNAAPHGKLRNAASKLSKRIIEGVLGGSNTSVYQSYRLILGEVGRSVAAYAGAGVYLDVALGWVAGNVTTAPVMLRDEGERVSGYSYRRLASHFWRMVLTSGTRGLRVVSVLGVVIGVIGVVFALSLVIAKTFGGADVQAGWTSLIVVMLLTSGATLFSLGIVAEYIGVAVNMAMGRPLYLIVSDPDDGPLGRTAP